MRIVRNRCLNRIESDRIRRALLDQSKLDPDETVSTQPPPSDRIEADEQDTIVRLAMVDLPDRQREALALYAFQQMSYREIADVLEIPINTVKTLIHRARASLAQALDSQEIDRDM